MEHSAGGVRNTLWDLPYFFRLFLFLFFFLYCTVLPIFIFASDT
jgi:hypothetical protein